MRNLAHWPAPAFHPQGDADPPDLPDFSDTISAQIEDTRRDLRALNLTEGGTRAERQLESLRQQLLDQALAEIKEIRGQVAKHNATIKTKASKEAFDLFAKGLSDKIDRRLDTVRSLVLAAVTIIGIFLAWISKLKGS